MKSNDKLTGETIRTNWAKYVQSPDQLAFSRLSKFPPGSAERLVDALDIREGERILEIGSGLGIMAGRIISTGRTDTVVGCEINEQYLRASPPECLMPSHQPENLRGDGFHLPFSAGTFHRVISHAVVTLMSDSLWESMHREIRRVLTDRGRVTHLDNIHNDRWIPEALRLTEEQLDRKHQFKERLNQLHVDLDTGYGETARDLPERLRTVGAQNITTDTYSWTLDLNDNSWDETQRRALLDLWKQFELDRIDRARLMLDERGEMTEPWRQRIDQYEQDVIRQARRRTEQLERGKPLGWYSSTTLSVTGQFAPD